jgi:hypothetical protein
MAQNTNDDEELKPEAASALKAGFVYLGFLFVVIIGLVLWYIGIF